MKMFRHEMKKIFSRWEVWGVLAVCCLLALAAFAEVQGTTLMRGYKHTTYDVVPEAKGIYLELADSPEMGSMLYLSMIGQIALIFLLPLLAAVPAGCSYVEEKKSRVNVLLIAKGGHVRYYWSKAAAVALSGFLVFVLPLLMNYLFCVIALPAQGPVPVNGEIYQSDPWWKFESALFPQLQANYPALNALVQIGLFGLWGMGLALLTYAVSLHFCKNTVVNLLLPTVGYMVLMLIFSFFKLDWLIIPNYFSLVSVFNKVNLIIPFAGLALPLCISAVLIWVKTGKKQRDIL